MSDKSDVHDALKAAGAPDYMVLIISKIMGAEDAVREMMAKLNEQAVDLKQREQAMQNHEQMLHEREKAFVDASRDMMDFANRLYGPDSELTKINAKLESIETAGATRDKRYTERFRDVDSNHSSFKDWVKERFQEVENRVLVLERDRKVG